MSKGYSGLSVALDLPTQVGLDSDHDLARGEVGKVGVAIDSFKDIEDLFDGIPLNKPRQISTTANSIGPVWAAMLIALGEKQGVSPEKYNLRLQNDSLKEFIARGTYIFPPGPSLKCATNCAAKQDIPLKTLLSLPIPFVIFPDFVKSYNSLPNPFG